MNDLIREISDLKKRYANLTIKEAEAKGRLDSNFKRLSDFNCKNISDAKQLSNKLLNKIERLDEKIQDGISEIKNALLGKSDD